MESSHKSIMSPEMKVANTNKVTKKKSKKPRCAFNGCRKKLSLTDWACKCEKKFCQAHRQAQDHGCLYNWRKSHQANLNSTMLKGKSFDTKNFKSI